MSTQKRSDLAAPIIATKQYHAQPVFRPENLLREARRQKGLQTGKVPPLCVLDPDGDIVRYLIATKAAQRDARWPCYHSELFQFVRNEWKIGIIGCAVGAPYAVLLAEQLFASGCQLLVSITSAGQLMPLGPTPYFVLVEKALRDEGTSYHYLPPAEFAEADPRLIERVTPLLSVAAPVVVRGATWTTDAPFRETESVIAAGRNRGLAAIEMECAALYAFARARGKPVVCLAHVTNTMAVTEGDFEKGSHQGALDALALVDALVPHVAE